MKKQQVVSTVFMSAVLVFSLVGRPLLAEEASPTRKVDTQLSQNDKNPSINYEFKRKSPAAAFGLSFGTFVLGCGFTVGSLFSESKAMFYSGLSFIALSPLSGHIYAKSYARGAVYTAFTAAGATMIAVGYSYDWGDEDFEGYNELAPTLMLAGTIVSGLAAIVGSIDAGFSAHRYNKKQQRFSLAPVVMPGAASRPAFGAQVNVRF